MGDELEACLMPFVNAMIPETAKPLRPILLGKVTDDIQLEMDIDRQDGISYAEMVEWISKGNTIIGRVGRSIEDSMFEINDPRHRRRRARLRRTIYTDDLIEGLCMTPCSAAS